MKTMYALALSAAVAATMSPQPASAAATQTLHGTILALPAYGKLQLADERGYVDDVTLRDATALYPRDLQLATGLVVVIIGHAAGKTFDADEIDAQGDGSTAASQDGGLPTYASPAGAGADTSGYVYDGGSTTVIYAEPIVTTYGIGGDPYAGYYGGYGPGYYVGGYPASYGNASGNAGGVPASGTSGRSTQPVYRRSTPAGYSSGTVHPNYAPTFTRGGSTVAPFARRAAPAMTRPAPVPMRPSPPTRR